MYFAFLGRFVMTSSAANEESLTISLPFLKRKDHGRCGIKSYDICLTGKFGWNDMTAASTPISASIFRAIAAVDIVASSERQYLIAYDKVSVVNSF